MPPCVRLLAPLAFLTLAACQAQPYDGDDTATVEPGDSGRPTTEYCSLTNTTEPIGECDRLRAQYADLDAGVDAFRPSENVREYEPVVIRYAITRLAEEVQGGGGEVAEPVAPPDSATGNEGASAETSGPTQEQIDTALADARETVTTAIDADAGTDEVAVRQIRIGRRMQACLDADASFQIDEGTRCQTIDTFQKPVAVWRWTVTPTEPGNHTLLVQSSVELTASDGTARFVPQRAQDARIAVEVTAFGRWKRFLATAESWVRSPLGLLAALVALVGAIGALLAAIRKARRGEAPAPPPPKEK